ncbi:MAG: hypothetical protein MJE63_00030, partial [Proteobacteria bacterium]|nr:hypothetical protein [Pseudomonadota bacterium]
EFTDVSTSHACELMIYYNSGLFLNAGIGNDRLGMFSIRLFDKGKWNVLASSGDGANIKPKTKYETEISVTGSRIVLSVNGVNACWADLPISLPVAQAGVWCIGKSDIKITDFTIKTDSFKVFVIMQYTSPYNELHEEVITSICDEFQLRVERADDSYGPGIICNHRLSIKPKATDQNDTIFNG